MAQDKLDNDGYEGDRTIDVNGTATNLNIQDTSITITDDEVKPTVTLAVDPTFVNETDGGNVMVTATLTPNGLTAGAMIELELGGTAVRVQDEDRGWLRQAGLQCSYHTSHHFSQRDDRYWKRQYNGKN